MLDLLLRRRNQTLADLLNLHLHFSPDLVDHVLDHYTGPDDLLALRQWLSGQLAPGGGSLDDLLGVAYVPPQRRAPEGSCEAYVRECVARFRGDGLVWQDTEDRRSAVRTTLHKRWQHYDAGRVRWAAVARNHPLTDLTKQARAERRVRCNLVELTTGQAGEAAWDDDLPDPGTPEPWSAMHQRDVVAALNNRIYRSIRTGVLRRPRWRGLLAQVLDDGSAARVAVRLGRDKGQVSAELRQFLVELAGSEGAPLLAQVRASRLLNALPTPVQTTLRRAVFEQPPC